MPRVKSTPVQRAAPPSDGEADTETLVARRPGGSSAVEAYAGAPTAGTAAPGFEDAVAGDGVAKDASGEGPIALDDSDEEEEGDEEEVEEVPAKSAKNTPAALAESNLPAPASINNFLAQLHAERAARMGGQKAFEPPKGQASKGKSGGKAEPGKARIATLSHAADDEDDEERPAAKSKAAPARGSKRSRGPATYAESKDFDDPEDGDYDARFDGTMADEDVPKKRKTAGKGATLSGKKPARAPAKKKPVHEVLDFDPEWTSMPLGALVLVRRQDELKKAAELAGDRVVVALYTVGRGAECRDMEDHIVKLAQSSASPTAFNAARTLSSSSSSSSSSGPPSFLKINHDATPAMSHAVRVSHFPTVCFWHKGRLAGERVVGWNGGVGGKEVERWIEMLGRGV